MKKLFSLASIIALALVLAACGNGGGGKDKTITVGASPAPHAEILEKAKPILKDKNYKIESAGNVHLEPMAVYSKKYKSLKELPKGATVYVSNNPAEEGRFLKFFSDAGLIKIKKGVKTEDAKFDDIVENKKDIK